MPTTVTLPTYGGGLRPGVDLEDKDGASPTCPTRTAPALLADVNVLVYAHRPESPRSQERRVSAGAGGDRWRDDRRQPARIGHTGSLASSWADCSSASVSSSTQSKVRVTAFFQLRNSRSRSRSAIDGVQR